MNTTNKLILDHLFYQSIQSRLAFCEDKNNIIESVIEGIQSSSLDDPMIEQRLLLCQLAHLTLGRTNHHDDLSLAPTTNNTALYYHSNNKSRCKCFHSSNRHDLSEAIPCFLKISAHKLRQVLDKDQFDTNTDKKPLRVAGQPVMGGGMPSRWYDLFLDLLTQAAIQAYLYDGKTGLETLYEIFSYGYIDEDDDDDDMEEEEEEESDVQAADHHLLFPKTRTMYLFNLQVHKREKELIYIEGKLTLEEHLKHLKELYPLYLFERNMSDFIQMILEDMDIPSLDKCDIPSPIIKSPEEDLPELHVYPEDGSILIPDIYQDSNIPSIHHPKSRKRSAFTAEMDDMHCNKRPCYH